MRLSQFDLIDTPAWNETIQTSYGKYSTLHITFRLSRHMGYFLIQVYVPCILIVVLSWVSFWLNREATADRVGLGITTVLTLTTTSMDTRNDLPKVHYATALDWFVIMCFGFVIGTLLQFAGVHYFTKIGSGEFEDSSDTEDDHWETVPKEQPDNIPSDSLQWTSNTVRNFPQSTEKNDQDHIQTLNEERTSRADVTSMTFVPRLTKYSWMLRFFKCLQGNAKYRRMMKKTASITGVNSVSKIDKVSRVLFPLTFLLLNLVYWIGYTRKSSDQSALQQGRS